MHLRIQFVIVSLLCVALLSCDNGSKTDKEIIRAMEESLISSNKAVIYSSEIVLTSLEEKTSDPVTAQRARIWFPKAKKVQEFTTEFYDYVEQLKKEKKIGRENASLLFRKLNECRNNILNTDSFIKTTFEPATLVSNYFDSSYHSEEYFFNRYFETGSRKSENAFLTKLQNNIIILGSRVTSFCNEQTSSYRPSYDYFNAIVGQSSEVVEPGKEINITAGVGAFSKAANPKITINGKEVPLNDSGFSRYKLNTPEKQGIYQIPVRISYTDQDGKEQYIETRIKYTVAKICNE